MNELSFEFILKSTKAKVLSRQQEIFNFVATDTRKAMDQALFVALKGDAFDAHAFLQKAIEQGATGLLIHDESVVHPDWRERVTIFLVPDTLKALQDLAQARRQDLAAVILGVAGSNGKTTSKEFCAQLLGEFRRVHASVGSLNNHWGVPFTLLAVPENCEVAVVEMGMNHAGELALLAQIAAPDIAVVTYVGVEHIEHFGTLAKIAEAEQEIYEHSPKGSLRIYNLDNEFTRAMEARHQVLYPQSRKLTFSKTDARADVCLKIQSLSMQSMIVEGVIGGKTGSAEVHVFGSHNVVNLMVAAASALAVGLTAEQIWSGLSACRTTWGRNQLVTAKSGALILFDGYNSNPDSMNALMENVRLLKVQGRKVGIFGEMRELGDLAPQLHQQTGQAVGSAGLDEIWFYGPSFKSFAAGVKESSYTGGLHLTEDFDEKLAAKLASGLRSGDVALVKGSRGMKMERFVKLTAPIDFAEKT